MDVNPGVAAAASKAFEELKKQWQVDSKGSFTSTNEGLLESLYSKEDNGDDDTDDDESFPFSFSPISLETRTL